MSRFEKCLKFKNIEKCMNLIIFENIQNLKMSKLEKC
jgi:hypothetical protein